MNCNYEFSRAEKKLVFNFEETQGIEVSYKEDVDFENLVHELFNQIDKEKEIKLVPSFTSESLNQKEKIIDEVIINIFSKYNEAIKNKLENSEA